LSGIKLVIIKQLTLASALRSFPETVSLALELIGVAIIVYGAIVTIIFLIKASALTNTTAAFADSNAISGVEGIFAALMGQPVQTGRPAA
jgi:hypothetical protein